MTIIPPEEPIEGKYSNLLNRLGQKFLMYSRSKCSLLVSCKQMISQPDSSILLARATHFLSELMPRRFQFITFHNLLLSMGNQMRVGQPSTGPNNWYRSTQIRQGKRPYHFRLRYTTIVCLQSNSMKTQSITQKTSSANKGQDKQKND